MMFFLPKSCKFCNHETPDKNLTSANTHETLIQCWINFGPPSAASAQLYLTNIRVTSRVRWRHYTYGYKVLILTRTTGT